MEESRSWPGVPVSRGDGERARGAFRAGTVRLAGLASLILGLSLSGCRHSPAPAADADPIPLGVTLAGDTLSTSDFRGDVVVVVLWATWCAPCRLAFADLDTLVGTFSPSVPVTVVAVSVDRAPGDLEAYLQSGTHDFPVTWDVEGKTISTLGVHGLPTYEVLDQHGVPRTRLVGYQSRPAIENAISRVLFRVVP